MKVYESSQHSWAHQPAMSRPQYQMPTANEPGTHMQYIQSSMVQTAGSAVNPGTMYQDQQTPQYHQQAPVAASQHHAPAVNNEASTTFSASQIGTALVLQYFKVMKVAPEDLARFYSSESQISRVSSSVNSDNLEFRRAAGSLHIPELLYKEHACGPALSKALIRLMECQETLAGGVFIHLHGTLFYVDETSRDFTMSILLLRQNRASGLGFYIVNDVMVYSPQVSVAQTSRSHRVPPTSQIPAGLGEANRSGATEGIKPLSVSKQAIITDPQTTSSMHSMDGLPKDVGTAAPPTPVVESKHEEPEVPSKQSEATGQTSHREDTVEQVVETENDEVIIESDHEEESEQEASPAEPMKEHAQQACESQTQRVERRASPESSQTEQRQSTHTEAPPQSSEKQKATVMAQHALPSQYSKNTYAGALFSGAFRPSPHVGYSVPGPEPARPLAQTASVGENASVTSTQQNNNNKSARSLQHTKTVMVKPVPGDMADDNIKKAVAEQLKGSYAEGHVVRIDRVADSAVAYLILDTEMCASALVSSGLHLQGRLVQTCLVSSFKTNNGAVGRQRNRYERPRNKDFTNQKRSGPPHKQSTNQHYGNTTEQFSGPQSSATPEDGWTAAQNKRRGKPQKGPKESSYKKYPSSTSRSRKMNGESSLSVVQPVNG